MSKLPHEVNNFLVHLQSITGTGLNISLEGFFSFKLPFITINILQTISKVHIYQFPKYIHKCMLRNYYKIRFYNNILES